VILGFRFAPPQALCFHPLRGFWPTSFACCSPPPPTPSCRNSEARAKHTSLARAQVSTLREHLFKLSARIEESVRRIVVHLPQSFPYARQWSSIARQLGAAPS